MRAPKQMEGYADRGLDCEEALEEGLAALEDDAIAAGWTSEELLLAVRRLAMEWLKGDAARQSDEANMRNVIRAKKRSEP